MFKISIEYFLIPIVLVVMLGVISCKGTDTPLAGNNNPGPWDTVSNFKGLIVPSSGTLTFKMNYQFKGEPIEFSSKNYTNSSNDTFTIKELKHYLSNITLTTADGKLVKPGNYHLLDAQIPSTQTFSIGNIPAGNYTKITFLLGVDAERNHDGLQEGALDPAWGMFWTWSTGYIFYRINGAIANGKTYSYDIGGDDNVPILDIDFSSFKVKSAQAKFNMTMEVNEMFQNPINFSMASDGNVIHSNTDPNAKKLAINMSDMITINTLLP